MYQRIILILTLMLSGRAMTLAFIHRAGGLMADDLPKAWLLTLIGDAVIGVSALWVAYLMLKKTGLWVWTTIIVWNSLAIWDVLSAYVIHTTNPWPEFFMINLLGSSMFFVASAMHLTIIILACRQDVREKLIG